MRSQRPPSPKGAKPRAVSAGTAAGLGGLSHGQGQEGSLRGSLYLGVGFALQKQGLQGALCSPSWTWAQDILGGRLVPGQGGSTRRGVTSVLPFPGTAEGDKKTEKSPTDDKVAVALTLHPKGPRPWREVGRGCRDLPAGLP